MGQAAQMKDLAALCQEGANIRSCVHGTGQDFGMFMRGLRLADQTSEDSGQRDGFFHGPPRRRWRQCLQMERKIVLDWRGGLDRFDLEGSADIGQGAGTKRQRLRVVGLPSLVLGTKVKGARVLQVRRQNDGLVSSLTGQLYAEIPGVEGHERELEILGDEVFLGEGIKPVDGIAEGPCIANMLPREGGQARCIQPSAFDHESTRQHGRRRLVRRDLLQRGVMGVLTGLTRTLSRCNCFAKGKKTPRSAGWTEQRAQQHHPPPHKSWYPAGSIPARSLRPSPW